MIWYLVADQNSGTYVVKSENTDRDTVRWYKAWCRCFGHRVLAVVRLK